ncbi:uncharacterized protein LOC100199564 isoform X3 [Hydra vulgaris]|uniref:Uncharacterized protein LOC100199564 isoform X3 n=1 Tax=Hydra vulgaris TaxID=6087 RepID=A0ABM4DB43_HYDVU
MEDTNVEEESLNSDVAASGLVALCDRVNNAHQYPELIDKNLEFVAAQFVEDSSLRIFVRNISNSTSYDKNNKIIRIADEDTSKITATYSVDDNNHITQIYDAKEVTNTSNIQEEIQWEDKVEESEVISLEHDHEDDHNNVEISIDIEDESTVKKSTLYDKEYVAETDDISSQNIEDSTQFSECFNEDDDGKLLLQFADVLDESYLQILKSRQALMREAVEWKVYARTLLEKGCSDGANFYEPEILTVLKATDDIAMKAEILSRITEKDMLQPSVQFWDFEQVYARNGAGRPLNCPSCSCPMTFVSFGQRFALRMLYDLDKPVLLVTSFLRCSNKGKKQHEILGYDPRLLRMFPNLDLPFMLFHKAGITKRMMEFIMENVINGMTVNRLFDVVKTKYEVNHTITSQFFANEIDSIREHVTAAGGQIEISNEAMFPPYVNCHPSKALLGRCFLASFKEKDDYYKFCMHQLLSNECIILDDSFCVGARIGLPGVWGNPMKLFLEEYRGILLVYNEAKHVLTWTFLKETCFSEVHDVLVELCDRHNKHNKSLKACFTTKCCEWRDDLRQIFGKWFIVKGNLRFFLDKIIKEMPSDHTYFKECSNELAMVFREPDDVGDVRKDYTTDPILIAHNLQEFMTRWKDVIDDQLQAVFPEKAVMLLRELEKHVQSGCLSGIPPEVGNDNFNEVHNALRKSISHCRITVPLVSALFSMCLHEINKNKGASMDFQYKSSENIHFKQINDIEETLDISIEGMTTVSIQTENKINVILQDMKEKKQTIMPISDIVSAVNVFYTKNNFKMSQYLIQALMYYKYEEDFDAFAPQAIKNLRLLPYYSSALNLISHSAFPREPFESDLNKIVAGLSNVELKIRRLHIDTLSCSCLNGSIDDIFYIVARQLIKDKIGDNLSVDVLEYLKFLINLGVQVIDRKEKDLIQALENLVGYTKKYKSSFLSNTSFENFTMQQDLVVLNDNNEDLTSDSVGTLNDNDEIDFLNSNSKAVNRQRSSTAPSQSLTQSNLMDIECHEAHDQEQDESCKLNSSPVPTNEIHTDEVNSALISFEFELLKKLADKLGAVITIITNLEHCWLIPIFPDIFNLFSPHFFVVYRFGRFFPAWLTNKASVSSIRNINLKRQGKEPQCRCGRGTPGKDDQAKCVSKDKGKYMTRCICFRLDRACGVLCDCRNCENPFGKKPEKMRTRKIRVPYRQRYAHEAAKVATCKSSALSTTIATQTNINEGDADCEMESWVPIEHCIFESLINEIKSDDNIITPLEVKDTFNSVVEELLIVPELSNIVHRKTIEQISQKLQQRERDVAEYLKTYQLQVDISLG